MLGEEPDMTSVVWLVGIAEGEPKAAVSLRPIGAVIALAEFYFEADHDSFIDWVWEHTEFGKLIGMAADKQQLREYQRAGFQREGVNKLSAHGGSGDLINQWYVGLSRPA